MNPTSLNDLVGRRLTSVTFIHDYVQLVFENYSCLSIFNPIRLTVHSGEIDQSQYGFKDFLCKFINRSVSNVNYQQEKQVAFIFDDAKAVSVGLADNDYSGPEAIVFTSGNEGDPILAIRIGD
jgi:hypothetical protein